MIIFYNQQHGGRHIITSRLPRWRCSAPAALTHCPQRLCRNLGDQADLPDDVGTEEIKA